MPASPFGFELRRGRGGTKPQGPESDVFYENRSPRAEFYGCSRVRGLGEPNSMVFAKVRGPGEPNPMVFTRVVRGLEPSGRQELATHPQAAAWG